MIMPQSIAHLAIVVRNYDEALEFYTHKLGFDLLQDTPLPGNKRWLLVAPPNSQGAALLLAEADTPEQSLAVGNQTGGRVFLFFTPTTSGAITISTNPTASASSK